MSKASGNSEMRPLIVVHILTIAVLALGWGYYCWMLAPRRLSGTGRAGNGVLGGGLDAALDMIGAVAGDVGLGFCTLILFGLGTGVYVMRVQVWLDARSAGSAVAYGGADLKDQAMAANAKRRTRS